MVATDLKISFQKLKIEVFKLNGRVQALSVFTGREMLKEDKFSDLFELLMNDVLISINRLTDFNPRQTTAVNITGLYSAFSGASLPGEIDLEYQTILALSRELSENDVQKLIEVDDEKRCGAIKQAGEVASHLKNFTDMLRPHVEQ